MESSLGELGGEEEAESMPLKRQHNKKPHRDTTQKQQFEKKGLGHVGGRAVYSTQIMSQKDRDHWKILPGTKELTGAISLHHPPA